MVWDARGEAGRRVKSGLGGKVKTVDGTDESGVRVTGPLSERKNSR